VTSSGERFCSANVVAATVVDKVDPPNARLWTDLIKMKPKARATKDV
jgi:hypothetical protein